MKAKREIKTVHQDGRTLVSVPLGVMGEKEAVLYEDDYAFLLKLGVSPNWSVHTAGYAVANCTAASGKTIGVARVLLDAGIGQAVRYRDKNPLNLRSENLVIVPYKGAIRRDRDLLTKTRNAKEVA